MPEYTRAGEDVIAIARRMITAYHPHLEDAGIGFLFRDEAPKKGAQYVYAKAKKVPTDLRSYVDLDFIIWIAEDIWEKFSLAQRDALVDHELCHLDFDGSNAKLRPHDVEEFNCILARHGFWWPASFATIRAVQPHLPLPELQGRVESVDPETLGALVSDDTIRKMREEGLDTDIWADVFDDDPPGDDEEAPTHGREDDGDANA